jgi:hypothetical protein
VNLSDGVVRARFICDVASAVSVVVLMDGHYLLKYNKIVSFEKKRKRKRKKKKSYPNKRHSFVCDNGIRHLAFCFSRRWASSLSSVEIVCQCITRVVRWY